MAKRVSEAREFFNQIKKDNEIIYILNNEDDTYYNIDDFRIDTEGDVVIDISLSG